AVSIYALEILMTIWFSLPSVNDAVTWSNRVKTIKAQGIEFDTRSKRQVAEDLRKRGVDAVPSLFPRGLIEEQADGSWKSPIRVNGTEVMPLSSVSNKLNVMCNENGPYVMFQSDQHGFNNPVRTWNHSPVDIVAVGDSYTEGYCLPD